MTRALFFGCNLHRVRDHHDQVNQAAQNIFKAEMEFIDLIIECDQRKTYVRLGYKSVMGYCMHGLRFTRNQAQRLITLARRKQEGQKSAKNQPDRPNKRFQSSDHLSSENPSPESPRFRHHLRHHIRQRS